MTEEHLKLNAYLITISDETERFFSSPPDRRENQPNQESPITSERWQVMNNQQTMMVTHY